MQLITGIIYRGSNIKGLIILHIPHPFVLKIFIKQNPSIHTYRDEGYSFRGTTLIRLYKKASITATTIA